MDGESPARPATRTAVLVAAAFLASLALRVTVARDLLAHDPLVRVAVLDDREYLAMARAMTEGRAEPWFFAPLYPWILSIAALAGALGMQLACLTNAVLGAAATATAAAAGCALHSRAAGIAAAGLHGLAGAFLFHDAVPGQETALALLHLVALLIAVRLTKGAPPALALVLGAVAGIAVLGRGTSVALALLAVPAMFRRPGERVRIAAMCAAGLASVLVPAAMRNSAVAGDFSPLPWARGPNLYAANGPEARETTSFFSSELSGGAAGMVAQAESIARSAAGRELTKGEVSAYWSQRAWAERGTLGEFATHTARKAALFLSADERGSNHSVLAERRYSPWLAWTPVHAWWLFAAGAAGWWMVRRRVPVADGVMLAAVGTWISLTLAFPVARYRLPVAALFAVVAACGIAEILRRQTERRRIVQACAILAATTLAALTPVRESAEGRAHVNLAVAHLQAGDPRTDAEAALRRALEVEPDCGPAREMLGRFALDDDDAASAYEHLAVAARDRRTRFSAQVAALSALVSLNRFDEALTTSKGLLAEGRADAELFANAALVEFMCGRRENAAQLLGAARRLAPEHPAVQRVAAVTRL